MWDINIENPEEQSYQNQSSADPLGILHLKGCKLVCPANTKGRVAVRDIVHPGTKTQIPAEKSNLKVEHALWVLRCKEYNPEGNKLQDRSPDRDEKEQEHVWQHNVKQTKNSPQDKLQSGIAVLQFHLKFHS